MSCSVIGAEVHALLDSFDNVYVIPEALMEKLGYTLVIEVYADSRTCFKVLAKDSKKGEKRLQIVAFLLT